MMRVPGSDGDHGRQNDGMKPSEELRRQEIETRDAKPQDEAHEDIRPRRIKAVEVQIAP